MDALIVAPQLVVTQYGNTRCEIRVPGYAVEIRYRPPLTAEESQAFYIAGGEEPFYTAAAGIHEAINDIIPQGLGL